MTVFVAQQPMPSKSGWMPDLSSAAEHGPIQYVFDTSDKVYALPGPSLFKARKALKNFDPEVDFFLWPGVGDPAALWACLIAMMGTDPEFITFLYWDRKRDSSGERDGRSGFYVPCKFNIKEKSIVRSD